MVAFFYLFSVKELISSQEVPSDKVILGGFSQGGALALYTALTMDKQVAGIVGLSTWMPMHKKFTEVSCFNFYASSASINWSFKIFYHIFEPINYEVKDNFSETPQNFNPLKCTYLG